MGGPVEVFVVEIKGFWVVTFPKVVRVPVFEVGVAVLGARGFDVFEASFF